MNNITIRPYQASDRDRLRYICYETGFMGDSPEFYWKDRKSFQIMWCGYYTDVEPESTFVGVIDEKVVGYVLGCVDSKKAWDPIQIGISHAIKRGCIFRPGTSKTMVRTLSDVATEIIVHHNLPPKVFKDDRWPSHLPIDILEEGRGVKIGQKLIMTLIEYMKSKGSPGLHLETLYENVNAIKFFKHCGFSIFGDPTLLPGIRSPIGERLHGQTLVMDL